MKFKVAFAGTPAFTIPVLEMLMNHPDIEVPFIITQPDKAVGRKKIITQSPVAKFAEEQELYEKRGIKIFKSENLNEIQKEISSENMDLIVVIAFGVLFPEWLLELPRKGCINIHYSLLPELRGASPVQSALINGNSTSGLTIFKLEKAMDSGAIVYQEEFKILNNENYTDILNKCENLSPLSLNKILIPYLEDKLKSTKQDDSKATFCYTFTKNDGQINWQNDSASDIYNKFRAFIEWPGIFTKWGKDTLKFIEIEVTDRKSDTPGKIYIEENKLYVQTKTTDIEIIKIQKSGKNIVKSSEFIRGYRPSIEQNPQLG